MSPEHCSRLFRQVSGHSPKEYMLNIRMTHARHMLSESNLSVGEIADRLGYRDLFFFSKQFKAKTGLAPTAFRSLKGVNEESKNVEVLG